MELGGCSVSSGCTVSGNCSVAGYWGPQPRLASCSRDLLIIPDCLEPMFCLTCVRVDLKANLLSPIYLSIYLSISIYNICKVILP
jgi:hypothetical protein